MSRLSNIGGALSQLINACIGGNSNESISARCYRQGLIEGDPVWEKRRKRVNRLFSRWEADHCRNAHLNDKRWSEQLLELYNHP